MNFIYKKVGKKAGHGFKLKLEYTHSSGQVQRTELDLHSTLEDDVITVIDAIEQHRDTTEELCIELVNNDIIIPMMVDFDGDPAILKVSKVQYFYCDCQFSVKLEK